ncbi:DUF3951 domain-containing protein [Paenibacillus allorhizosphaerae]|uniref:DUF3951 domain-containing protein n=1 Tax=Paenibacillus allorhizosphaerae TaxID=2849866 RepID=A0ABM8VT19_9BACL|nr:DUF3951 domain-containing protein [Paenibacillus allorhizosphaerae]CAG7657299.1 hypothetical protein PAECIP111802_06685 [Paenibacillus allorhizosphaerae]
MDYSAILVLSLIVPVFVLIVYIMIKAVMNKEVPDSRYTPFDYITGQKTVQFHEHKEDKEEEDAHGDDKDKNEKKSAPATKWPFEENRHRSHGK